MATTSTPATISGFNGQSSYASDLSAVITRAVGIANLPITNLQNMQSTLTGEQSELSTVGSKFQDIQTALNSLNSDSGTGSYTASVDNSAVATATPAANVLAGNYAVTIASIGSQTNTTSVDPSTGGLVKVTDPSSGSLSTSANYTLTVNGTAYTFAPASNTLNSLVQSINASAANVQATIVNIGGSASPDYRLSIQSGNYAPDTVTLSDGTNSLLQTVTTGTNVTYQINGQPATPISSNSRSLAISPGLTVNVATVGTVNVKVAQSTENISNDLSSFVSAFNAATDEVSKSRGQNGGALAGQSILSELNSSLLSLSNYSASSTGPVNSIADLGITFDQNGHLQYDASVFNAAISASPVAVSTFLGSETSTSLGGGGFINAAFSAMTSLTDPITGAISLETQSIGKSVSNITTQISTKQDQVKLMQTNLTAQIAAADANISALESQVTQITDLFTAMTQASKNITG